MNNLVATAETRVSLYDHNVGAGDAFKVAKIIGPGKMVKDSLSDLSNPDVLGAISGGVSAGMDVVGFVLDPIASMAGSAANFLLEYMPPLPQMLDAIAGNPAQVAAQAGTWYNVADRVSTTATDLRAAVDSALAGWEGLTADAYQAHSGFFAEALDGLSAMYEGIGKALSAASTIVAFVRSIVRDVISDLVGKLISWTAKVAFTAGIGAAWVVPEAVAAIGIRVSKVTGWLKRAVEQIRRVLTIVKEANGILKKAVPVFQRMSTRLKKIPLAVSGRHRLNAPKNITLDDAFSPNISKVPGWENKAKDQYEKSAEQSEGDTGGR